MVTPRNQRYKRKVNSALDLSKMAAANDPKQAYEKSTKKFINPQQGLGPFNDINVGAFYRFGKENVAKNLVEALKWNGGKYRIVGADDVYGQSTSVPEETFAANALENVIRNRKMSTADLEAFLNTSNRTAPGMAVLEGGRIFNEYLAIPYIKKMLTGYTKMPKGPGSAYQHILEKFKG